jgi:hypothetical protein
VGLSRAGNVSCPTSYAAANNQLAVVFLEVYIAGGMLGGPCRGACQRSLSAARLAAYRRVVKFCQC